MGLSEKALNNKKQYSINYAKDKYKRIPLDVPIKKYEEIKQYANDHGETVNGFIKRAIDKAIEEE